MNYREHIIRLQTEINRIFGRAVTSMFDFRLLAGEIYLSTQILRHFYDKIDRDKQLSAVNLDLICQYIGLVDWEGFCVQPDTPKVNIHELINVFYDTIAYSGATFLDPKPHDTHGAYAESVIEDLPYACTFLKRYKTYPIITQSLYPQFPYYNQMAQRSYIQLIEVYLAAEPLKHLHVCQDSFLTYGAFCVANEGRRQVLTGIEKYVKDVDKYVDSIYQDYPDNFFHYLGTRYTIAKVAQAYLQGNEQEATRVAEAALTRNSHTGPLYAFDEYFQTPGILVSKLCNALIWMGGMDLVMEIYSTYSEKLFSTEDPAEHQSENFVYERDINSVAQTVKMMYFFNERIPLLELERQPHWRTQHYEEIQQWLITLKRIGKQKFSERRVIKEHPYSSRKKLNCGVVENLIERSD